MPHWTGCFFLGFLLLFVVLDPDQDLKNRNEERRDSINENKGSKTALLLGASVGRAWNISELNKRMDNNDYTFEYMHGGSTFDKSEKLRQVISRMDKKPDIIFIKECAAYFPGDLDNFQKLMKQWVNECKNQDVIPIPTTVVPVTRLHPFKKFLIDIIKIRNPFKFGNPFKNVRNRSILEYNDWIRSYCDQNGLSFLDLEAATRFSEDNRYLREDFAKIDGLHINSKAYLVLDKIVIPVLESVNWEYKVKWSLK